MNWLDVLGLAITLIEGVLANMPTKGASAETLEQIQNARAALAKLREFHGSPVTKAQLEGLRG